MVVWSEDDFAIHAIDTVGVRVVLVVTKLVHYVQQDHKARSHSDSQSEDVDRSIEHMLPQVAKSDEKKILNHNPRVFIRCPDGLCLCVTKSC